MALPARLFWNAAFLKTFAPQAIFVDDRPNAPAGNFCWAGDRGQVGQVLYAFRSAWLPVSLLQEKERPRSLRRCSRAHAIWGCRCISTRGWPGAPAEEIAAARDTAVNPAVLDAFALAICAAGGPPAFPGVKGHEANLNAAGRAAGGVTKSMNKLLEVVEEPGSYVSESDFFESQWRRSYWGSNYPRLATVKRKYDPDGLFFVHHGVGSEEWSDDGFTRLRSG